MRYCHPCARFCKRFSVLAGVWRPIGAEQSWLLKVQNKGAVEWKAGRICHGSKIHEMSELGFGVQLKDFDRGWSVPFASRQPGRAPLLAGR